MILLMGPTGSGKTTQGRRLADKYGMAWVSVGQLLRGHLEGADKDRYKKGELVATERAMAVLDKFLADTPADQSIMLDGAPRNEEQLEEFNRLLKKHNRQLQAVILISVPEQEIYNRLRGRARLDDPAVARKLSIYREQTVPVVDKYQDRGLVHTINGVGSVEAVSERIERVIDGLNQER